LYVFAVTWTQFGQSKKIESCTSSVRPHLNYLYNKTMGKSTKQSVIKAKNNKLKIRGIPRRPLSSYNMFFSLQRKKIVDEQQLSAQVKNDGRANVGFANLANIVAQQCKNVDPALKAELDEKAHQDRIRYKNEMREWEMKQKMEADVEEIKADLETTETEVKTQSEVGEALVKIAAMKRELEQIKRMNKMKPEKHDEKKETVPAADSKADDDVGTEMAVADLNDASPAADINEAIAFLKETLTSPISRRHSIAIASCTPFHTRNVLGVSAMTSANAQPSLICIGNVGLGMITPSSIHCSPWINHDALFDTATTYPQLPFSTTPRFARRNSMPTAGSLQAPFAASMRMTGNVDRHNTGAPSRWPPRSELQRFFGIKPSSQENTATA
jgi:hypothetical protein